MSIHLIPFSVSAATIAAMRIVRPAARRAAE